MSERHSRDREFVISPLAANDAAMPIIETPVIQIQDLEYTASEDTRINNKGVPVRASVDEQKTREAIAELEAQFAKLPPV